MAFQLPRDPGGEGDGYQQNLSNIGVVLADLSRIGKALAEDVSAALSQPVRTGTPEPLWNLRPAASGGMAGSGGSLTWVTFRRLTCCWSWSRNASWWP